jgi:hypothetical protein
VTCSFGTGDLEVIGEAIADNKVVIGVIDHHTLQVERAGSSGRSDPRGTEIYPPSG